MKTQRFAHLEHRLSPSSLQAEIDTHLHDILVGKSYSLFHMHVEICFDCRKYADFWSSPESSTVPDVLKIHTKDNSSNT